MLQRLIHILLHPREFTNLRQPASISHDPYISMAAPDFVDAVLLHADPFLNASQGPDTLQPYPDPGVKKLNDTAQSVESLHQYP